jgi:hypothetical protein
VTLLVFLENWGSVFLNKPRKTIKEKNKNQQLKFKKKKKKKYSVREWRNDRVTWEWSGEPDVESWCLATGFSSSMGNLERIEFQKWRICECFLGIGGWGIWILENGKQRGNEGGQEGKWVFLFGHLENL